MDNFDLDFTIPGSWKVISPKNYKQFSIISTKDTPCYRAFAAKNPKTQASIISMYDYGEAGEDFISELNSQLTALSADNSKVSEINDYIEENGDGFSVTKTDYLKPIYFKKGVLNDKKVFISIMQIKTNLSVSYSLQIFTKVNGHMICITTSALDVDEARPFNSLLENYQHVNEIANVLIKSIH
ncbi:MAG: hypothetical protein RR400_00825 [Clostridia bacterium]